MSRDRSRLPMMFSFNGAAWSRSTFVALIVVTMPLRGADYVVPVSTGLINGKVYTTTVGIRNDAATGVACDWLYEERGGARRWPARDEVAPGQTLVHEDFAGANGVALGIARATCSAGVTIGARVQISEDGGSTFPDPGRVFDATPALGPVGKNAPAALSVGADLLVVEVDGKPVAFEIAVRKGKNGETIGVKRYATRAYGLEIVNLAHMRALAPEMWVEVRVDGPGQVIAERITEDAKHLQLAVRKSSASSPPGNPQQITAASVALSGNAAVRALVLSSFKAAPFEEPATGLVNMRDRWYSRETGTFISPDRNGYGGSANLYSYCGGDPVNCSDPTGFAAAVSKSGAIVGMRPDGTWYRFGAGYGKPSAQRRIEVQLSLESDKDLTESDVRGIMMRAGLKYGPTSFPCEPGETCLTSAAPPRASDHALGSALRLSNTVNTILGGVNEVVGEAPFPTPDPENERQRFAYDRTGDVLHTLLVPAAIAGLFPRGLPAGKLVGDAYNISTAGMSANEREAVIEYARRTNEWLDDAGAQVVSPTKGPLRRGATAAARRERLRAERAGDAYAGQVGHVPDTAISGRAEPPAGWLDMPGISNQCCGGGLGARIGKPIRVVTVDGKVPAP
jgi:RHS repeat-associated protein